MSGNKSGTWRVRDPVHGLILFGGSGERHRDETDRIAWRLLNTPEFQRLRRIRQLGFSDLVFPGATHSRFAHSIGVYHTARRLADIIARQMGEKYDHDRERVALLAALLHDIGHGPFSHAFEDATPAGLHRRHEDWSREIVQAETEVNRVLRDVDEKLPEDIGRLLNVNKEGPEDIYATVVSSQFDADRLDYVQRDRMATGVECGHIDQEWLFDCLAVGSIPIGDTSEDTSEDTSPKDADCLYLGPKGLSVAEEYLEARFRLYRMVYMHKTTRAAEKMLASLLKRVASEMSPEKLSKERRDKLIKQNPVLEYFASETPSRSIYLKLDDAAIWSALTVLEKWEQRSISDLAKRLRDRKLYKCIDIGIREQDQSEGRLFLRFKRKLNERKEEFENVLLDEPSVKLYEWYGYDEEDVLNKLFVKPRSDLEELVDIASVSPVVNALRSGERIRRVYAPSDKTGELLEILEEIKP